MTRAMRATPWCATLVRLSAHGHRTELSLTNLFWNSTHLHQTDVFVYLRSKVAVFARYWFKAHVFSFRYWHSIFGNLSKFCQTMSEISVCV